MSITQTFYDRCLWLQNQRENRHLLPIKRWVVALSGGLDSIVTLHLASQLLPSNSVFAVHVNHQLQPKANDWQLFCEQLCNSYNIPIKSYVINPRGVSELLLRDARYDCFIDFINEDDCLLFGHHANDQAETMLFRMVRGAGSKGVSGIPAQREIGKGHLLRPLLALPKDQLERYAIQSELEWVEDPSNQSLDYDRNYLRHEVVKPLIKHWPKACEKMALSASLIEQEHQLLNSYLEEDLHKITQNNCFDLQAWKKLSKMKAFALLRLWLNRETQRIVSAKQLKQIDDQLINSREDAKAHSILGSYTLKRYRQSLFVFSTSRQFEKWPELTLDDHQVNLKQGKLTIASSSKGIQLKPGMYWETAKLGLSIKAENRPTKKLKKLFQEAGIAPWQRENWPLLKFGEDVVAVAGICVCEGWLEDKQNKSVFCLDWQPL
jgi:tRNA(Ile)-lysidine synthase